MFDAALLSLLLADVATVLTASYWGGLIIGGGLLVVSILGGHDSDVDVDVDAGFDFDADADLDFDVDADAGVDVDLGTDVAHAAHGGFADLTTWFSLRFVVFFAAVFGAIGVILTYLTGLHPGITFVIALAVGLLVGQGVHQTFRLIRRTSGDSAPRPQDYVNKLARVTIAISHPQKGEVALQVRGARRFVPAVTSDAGQSFKVGDEVVVVGYRAGVARVVSREEFEQRSHCK